MNAVSMNNLWAYIQGLSLTARNRQWLAERLIESDDKVPPVLQTMEEALSDLYESKGKRSPYCRILGHAYASR